MMKLNFKDLKQSKWTVDAEPSETVADVKEKVAAEKGFEAANIKLIWSGKILADAQTIGSYEIKPADHIVCMVSKPKATTSQTAAKAPSTPAPVTAQTPSAPAPAPAFSMSTTNAPTTPSPAAPARDFNPSSDMALGANRQAAIANMEAMGFERSQCERALRAAYFNAERAVEYLITGIPESAEQQAPPPSNPTTQTPAPTASNTTGEDEPVNLFEAAAAQGGGAVAGSGARGNAVRAMPGDGAGGANTESVGANLDFLRNDRTFQGLRQSLQQNPGMLEGVLQQLGSSNPQLAQAIAQNPDAFLHLLNEDTEGEGVGMPPGAQAISVTEAERDAIERLTRLGFERDLCIQAYFACDKNEELAANFLFEHLDDEGGQ